MARRPKMLMQRGVRFSDEEWEALKRVADANGRTASAEVRWLVRRHIAEHEGGEGRKEE